MRRRDRGPAARPRGRIEVARVVAAPGEIVWALLARPARWPEWGPSVTAVRCDDAVVRTGTTGRVRTVVGVWVPFSVTDVDPGRAWRWRVGGVPATGHRVEPVARGAATRVVFEVPWWASPYALVCWVALRRIAGRAAADQPRGTSRSS